MIFDEQLRITLLDKGLLAAILALAAFALNWLLEERKARNELLKAISLQRVDAYKKLWALLEAVKASDKAEIPNAEKERLAVALTTWYYEDGGGLFLSRAAADQCFAARRLLEAHTVSAVIRVRFSELRSQLKYDCGIQSRREQRSPHKYTLPKKWSKVLLRQPETGMGYQIVAVTLRDGRIVPDVVIVGGSVIGEVRGHSEIPFDPAEIEHIEVTHNKWDFQLGALPDGF